MPSTIVPTPSVNNCLYRISIHLTSFRIRPSFAEGVGTIDFKPSIEIVDLVLAFASYRMLFANFLNDPTLFNTTHILVIQKFRSY